MSPSRLRTAVLGSTGRRPTTATLAGSASPADWCSGSAQAGRLCPLAHTRLQAGNARESRYRCETPASGFPRSQSPRNQRDELVELNGDVLVLTAEHAQPSPSGLSPKGCCGVSMRTETAPRRVCGFRARPRRSETGCAVRDRSKLDFRGATGPPERTAARGVRWLRQFRLPGLWRRP